MSNEANNNKIYQSVNLPKDKIIELINLSVTCNNDEIRKKSESDLMNQNVCYLLEELVKIATGEYDHQTMITAATLSKSVIKKVIDSQIPKDKLILLCGNLISSASSINISLNIKKELTNSIRSVILNFELTGNEDKIYEGIFPYVKQILQEDIPEKIIVGLICLKDIFDITDRKLYDMFIDTKVRVLQIASK